MRPGTTRKRIIPCHLQLAIRNDEEINKLLGRVAIAQGSILPNIQTVLLPKKTATTKQRAREAAEWAWNGLAPRGLGDTKALFRAAHSIQKIAALAYSCAGEGWAAPRPPRAPGFAATSATRKCRRRLRRVSLQLAGFQSHPPPRYQW